VQLHDRAAGNRNGRGRKTSEANKISITSMTFMKHLIRNTFGVAALAAMMAVNAPAQNQGPGFVDFGKFSPPSSGGEFVEVHINGNLISLVARLADKAEPEIAKLVRGLKLIHVNVIGLNDDNRSDVLKRVQAVRADLSEQHWEGVVTAQQSGQDVNVFLKTRGDEAVEGLVVTVIDGNHQAILVNVVGDIKPEQVAIIGERFNIEPLKKVGQALGKK
jgi:hypothetical protein